MRETGAAGRDTAVIPSSVRGSNQSGLRAHNERLVLSILRRHGPLAKAPISRMTGLSAQTVSVIMRRLEEDGLLLRGEPVRGKVGQPSVPMALNPEGALFFGLKIGRRSLDLVMIDFTGGVLGRRRMTHAYPDPDKTVRFAVEGVQAMLDRLDVPLRGRVCGLGIATPFFLWDWARAIGVPPSDMASWRTRDIAAEIEAGVGLPTFLQNDATSACGAELVFGEARDSQDFVYFYIGFFVGGGLVLDGRLHTGRTGNSAALGSMPVPGPDGGSRQLIEVASLACLERLVVAEGLSAESLWEEPETWSVPVRLVDQWIAEAADGLAHAIAASASIVDIGSALIDGWLPATVRAELVRAVRARINDIDLAGLAPPAIETGSVGPDARALGAASLPLSESFLVDPSAMLKP
ncbi:ROK family transcriptional regulator [Salipiger mucosus]|uniref:Transcriptional regulator FrcR for fructose utilization, ROK family n=1 Tax=Salipiger mucosus DSM 16094 TaxID=1123237 RepID=S9Q6Y1_9RHOB|nr:ROK family transcriptional regulator [Salipiger mucosus]EPX75403.1 Transcriptional regulator FrcR for fructose utilization, ROK family [Salipiger mucosus DSM 16094]